VSFFLSTIKKHSNIVISTFEQYFKKDNYFYIVSRQEETRFQLVSKDKKALQIWRTFLSTQNSHYKPVQH